MASLTRFIEGRMRLKINQDKSAVARPEDRHFLGFRLRSDPQTGAVEVLALRMPEAGRFSSVASATARGPSMQAAAPRASEV